MKKRLCLAGALLCISAAATAQTQPVVQPSATAPVGVQRIRKSAAEIVPEQEADQTASILTGQLTLNPDQTARVRAAALTWSQEHRALLVKHNAMTDHSTLQAEGAAIDAKYDSLLNAILTPAQIERRQVIQARYRRIREQAGLGDKPGSTPAAPTRP